METKSDNNNPISTTEKQGTSNLSATVQLNHCLDVMLSYIPYVNLALQQNALPIVQELRLTNQTDEVLTGLECVFSSPEGIIQTEIVSIEQLNPHEILSLNDLGIKLDYRTLSSLSDSLKGSLSLEIQSQGRTLFGYNYPQTALAIDQWTGSGAFPEILAAFVTPNLDAITQLLPQIAATLQKATGSSSIEGYQGDKERVYNICRAIYHVLQQCKINYSNPAASFGQPGQRIRFADNILQNKIGTCLDTTLLTASVMEACHLHPVIMLMQTHAYIGCHLVKNYFQDMPADDLQNIRKLVDMDEFIVFETTMLTGESTFAQAEEHAKTQHLVNDEQFECAIDVVRARNSNIHPLPLKRTAGGVEYTLPEDITEEMPEAPVKEFRQRIDLSTLKGSDGKSTRMARWSQKLLDLSLRNRLLNVRDTKLTIPLACPDIMTLEDKIAAKEVITLGAIENRLCEKDIHDLMQADGNLFSPALKPLFTEELRHNRILAALPEAEMKKRLIALYRQGKTDLEEGGVNTLFIAIGFLEWRETARDAKAYRAPILLVPVRLQRPSINSDIQIVSLDEDTLINETLLEYLRTQYHLEVNGLSPLPTDQSGVDVGMVLQIFRQTIEKMSGWEVYEEAWLGQFSFGKFVMWNDLTVRADDLMQNPLVKHLNEGGGLFDDGISVFPPDEIDKNLDLRNLYCPKSADSSQLTAVLYSALGKSFVLHGPPGTGKSQTITNIIAHSLALGRKVLFVSEKKAALDVVHKRLSEIGLRPFCLELHSSKSGKTEVLAQFTEALNVPETMTPEEWQRKIGELESLRKNLDEYVAALHRHYPNGFSAYDCFSRLMQNDRNVPDHLLDFNCLLQTEDDYHRLLQQVNDLATILQKISWETLEGLSLLKPADWNPIYERSILASAQNLREQISALQETLKRASDVFCIPKLTRSEWIADLVKAIAPLKDVPGVPESLTEGDYMENQETVRIFRKTLELFTDLNRQMGHYNTDMLSSIDLPGLKERIEANGRLFFISRFFKNRALLKELTGLKKLGGGKLTIYELGDNLPLFEKWLTAKTQYESQKDKAYRILGRLAGDTGIDWKTFDDITAKTNPFVEFVRKVTKGEQCDKALSAFYAILTSADRSFEEHSDLRNHLDELCHNYESYQGSRTEFAPYANSIADIADIDIFRQQVNAILENRDSIRWALRYFELKSIANEGGLNLWIPALEARKFDPEDSKEIFETSYMQMMLEQILTTQKILASFNGMQRRQQIQQFRTLDSEYMNLSKQIIFAKLAAGLPRRRSGPCPANTELGILKHECEKKARQKAVRQLLSEIPNLAPVLKPCFLMSPMSVAQYLPPDTQQFDLIVFDEASQIPVWDAIGVIARGKQLIVVGDPKQMPPTNFFQKGDSADGEDDSPTEIEDLESILDECLAAGVYSCYLNWHYRSKHESLISFSNHYYYDDRLFTFPAASKSKRLGVGFRFIEKAVYDKSNKRTNKAEATALVQYVFEQLEMSGDRKRSIGIVTFSEAQKNLIEDLLENERAKHPALESYFSDQNEEPLFVKNLENVQGDERDVILFSICYAPDKDGKFSMNFGPLNRQGGERRLNVAITRAKEQVIVFSSIHASQIDLTRTNAVGAKHLKFFLDYAEKGVSIGETRTEAKINTSGLAATVCEFLHKNGYSIERNVGCSGYRIDIAVHHPENAGEFLLGIECDGPEYAQQQTARDRDLLRSSVLSSLGWHIWQAWSVDWMFDRKHAEQELLDALEQAKQTPTIAKEPEPPKRAIPDPQPVAQPVQVPEKTIEYYHATTLECTLAQESFYEDRTRPIIRDQFLRVIQQEAPICEKLLRKRVSKAWGFTRTGDNIRKVLDQCIPTGFPTTPHPDGNVFWQAGQEPADYTQYRANPSDAGNKRAIDEIPTEEITNAMLEVLQDFHSVEEDILYRETLKLFGFAAVTDKARKYLASGLDSLKASGRLG